MIKSEIMNFVQSKGTATRREIVQFYVEKIKGRIFDPIKDRNVLTVALGGQKKYYKGYTRGYLRRSAGKDKRFLAKKKRNEYYVEKGV